MIVIELKLLKTKRQLQCYWRIWTLISLVKKYLSSLENINCVILVVYLLVKFQIVNICYVYDVMSTLIKKTCTWCITSYSICKRDSNKDNTLREYDIIYRKLNCKYKLKTWFTWGYIDAQFPLKIGLESFWRFSNFENVSGENLFVRFAAFGNFF